MESIISYLKFLLTVSTPSTDPWRFPYLNTRRPPAFVDKHPPTWQLAFAPKSIGTVKPFSCAFCSNCSSIQPDSQTAIPVRSSIFKTLFRRWRDRTISSQTGTDPPTRPVFPPWGHIASFLLLQYFNICEIWSVEFGFNKSWLLPKKKTSFKVYYDSICLQRRSMRLVKNSSINKKFCVALISA